MALNGQTIIATSGVAQVFSTASIGPGTYLVRADHINTGTYCYLGYTSVTVTTLLGYPLAKTDDGITITTVALEDMWVNTDTSADVICWIRVEGENQGVRAPAG